MKSIIAKVHPWEEGLYFFLREELFGEYSEFISLSSDSIVYNKVIWILRDDSWH